MRQWSGEQAWRMTLTAVALTATAMALYVQVFGLRSRQEEARAAAARLDDALAESRSRLKAEILAELRAELENGDKAEKGKDATSEQAGQPIPDTVIRRLESAEDESGALGQAFDPTLSGRPPTISRLAAGLKLLAAQSAESDRALRRDLDELHLATRRELDVSRQATSLILAALIPLVLDLLYSVWRGREQVRRSGSAGSVRRAED
jgi:hypothetical protein